MSLPTLSSIVTKVKSLKISVLYRDFIFTFFTLLFLSGLPAFQSVFASNSHFNESLSHEVGYAFQQRSANFIHAQRVFENQDYVYSAQLFAALAKQDHIQAQYLLAIQYDLGLGVKKDTVASFHWYKKAARAGVDIAQHNLAVAYAQGSGIKEDLAKAIIWWKRAAKQGHTDSQFNLGIIYATGKGIIKPDIEQALKWWRMAANNGDAAAQFNLGTFYASGVGRLPARMCEAARWLKRSQQNGFKQAHNALSQMQALVDITKCK